MKFFYDFFWLRLSLLNVSMSNYTRHDCSINPTPWTRLNFTIDDLRALISRSRVVSTFFAMSCSGLRGPPLLATRYCDPEPWLFINHPVVSMTDWLTAGERYYIPTVFARKLMLVVGIFLVSDRLTREPCLKTFLCFPLSILHRVQ